MTVPAKDSSIGDFTYYVEFRKNDRWDRALSEPSVVIHQVRQDQKNYLVPLARGKNHLSLSETFTDSGNGIKIKFVDYTDNVANIEVTSPVTHKYREAVDGPVMLDWHIYERVLDTLHEFEKSRLQLINTLVKQINEMGRR